MEPKELKGSKAFALALVLACVLVFPVFASGVVRDLKLLVAAPFWVQPIHYLWHVLNFLFNSIFFAGLVSMAAGTAWRTGRAITVNDAGIQLCDGPEPNRILGWCDVGGLRARQPFRGLDILDMAGTVWAKIHYSNGTLSELVQRIKEKSDACADESLAPPISFPLLRSWSVRVVSYIGAGGFLFVTYATLRNGQWLATIGAGGLAVLLGALPQLLTGARIDVLDNAVYLRAVALKTPKPFPFDDITKVELAMLSYSGRIFVQISLRDGRLTQLSDFGGHNNVQMFRAVKAAWRRHRGLQLAEAAKV